MSDDTDRELFASAMSDAPAEAPADSGAPTAETPAAEPAKPQDDNRDPTTGRYVAKAKEGDPAPPAIQPTLAEPIAAGARPQQADAQEHRIPLAEHLSVRERAQRAEQERDAERQRITALERRIAELSRQPAEPPEPVDVWADLPGALGRVESSVQQQLAELRLQNSVDMARFKHGELFDAALKEAQAAAEVDPSLNQRIFASRNVGEAIVQWYREQKTLKEIGGDPEAYVQRRLEEKLKDPEVIKRILDDARLQAQTPAPGGQRPPTQIQLPPSLGRITSAAPNGAVDEASMSDRELFREAMRG